MQKGEMRRLRLKPGQSAPFTRCISVSAVGATMDVSPPLFCKPVNLSAGAPLRPSEEQEEGA